MDKDIKEFRDYIELCFIDFIDDGRFSIRGTNGVICLGISIPDEYVYSFKRGIDSKYTIEGNLEICRWRIKQIEEIESALLRIKNKYRIFYSLEFSNKSQEIISISLSRYRSSLKQIELSTI